MNRNKLKTPDALQILERNRAHTLESVTQEIIRKIKTPLSLIRGRAEKLKGQLEHDQKENTQGILDQIQRLEDLMGSVQKFASFQEEGLAECSLFDLFEDLISLFQLRLGQSQIHVTNLIPENLRIQINSSQLRQVLISLFINAIETLEGSRQEHKNIFFHFQKSQFDQIISIEDNGPGLSLSSIKNGQSILSVTSCKKMAEAQGWTLKIQNREKLGTRIDVCIPLKK